MKTSLKSLKNKFPLMLTAVVALLSLTLFTLAPVYVAAQPAGSGIGGGSSGNQPGGQAGSGVGSGNGQPDDGTGGEAGSGAGFENSGNGNAPSGSGEVDVFEDACKVQGASSSEVCSVSGADPLTGDNGVIARVTRTIAYIAGVAAIIIMIIAGLMYVLANGSSDKIRAARDTFLYALIGLIIVVCAQAIIIFVINNIR